MNAGVDDRIPSPSMTPEIVEHPSATGSNVDLLSQELEDKIDVSEPSERSTEEPELERSSELNESVPAPEVESQSKHEEPIVDSTNGEGHISNGPNVLDQDTNYQKLLLTRGQDFDLDYTLLVPVLRAHERQQLDLKGSYQLLANFNLFLF